MSDKYCLIQTTCGSQDEADHISETLVARSLAACVQVSSITSTYRWKGKIQKEPEYLLLIKTRADLFDKIKATILEIHSYEVPEIIQIPITQGLESYLSWIDGNTSEEPGVE